jgi:hypothetical protein
MSAGPSAGGRVRVPPAALLLGAAGLLPFLWGAGTLLAPDWGEWSRAALGARWTGRPLLVAYGAAILAFMAGTIWGFASRAPDGGRRQAWLLGLSVLPALVAAFAGWSVAALLLGFLGLLPLDRACARRGLAPGWWMRLRLPLTAGVVLCLLPALP